MLEQLENIFFTFLEKKLAETVVEKFGLMSRNLGGSSRNSGGGVSMKPDVFQQTRKVVEKVVEKLIDQFVGAPCADTV